MVIDFEKIHEKVLENFNGGEKALIAKMNSDEQNKILYGKLEPGATIGLHTHDTSSEIIYFLKGTGKVLYDGEYEEVKEGVCHYCLKGHEHSLINDSNDDLIFFAVVPQQ